ncbi:MAG: 2-hydroxyacid dehydrogenase [Firmicutes bacterium]|nr:2-hydroxyacid dehydrogenase [Bacillota bacterium]
MPATFAVLSLLPKKRFLEAAPRIPEGMSIRHYEDGDDGFRRHPAGYRGVLGVGTVIPPAVMAASELEIIQLVGAGYDQVDLPTVEKRGLILCNNPGANAQAVAEHVLMALLYFARRQGEAEAVVYSSEYARDRVRMMGPLLRELGEMTLGIVGFGAIGQTFSRLVRPFGSTVLVHSRTRYAELERAHGVAYRDLTSLLQESDAVIVTLPSTPDTHRLFDAARLALLKSTCIFINVGRGGVVDHDALASALIANQLYAASLDVYDPEPLDQGHPLLNLDVAVKRRLLLSPHTAGVSHRSWTLMVQRAVDNLWRYASTRQPEFVVRAPRPAVLENEANR